MLLHCFREVPHEYDHLCIAIFSFSKIGRGYVLGAVSIPFAKMTSPARDEWYEIKPCSTDAILPGDSAAELGSIRLTASLTVGFV